MSADERVAALAVIMRRTSAHRHTHWQLDGGEPSMWATYARMAAWSRLVARAWGDLADAHLGAVLSPGPDAVRRGRAADSIARRFDSDAETWVYLANAAARRIIWARQT